MWQWFLGNRVAQGIGGALLAFIGWTAWLAARDHRIRKERDLVWRNRLADEEMRVTDRVQQAEDELDRELANGGVEAIADRDPHNKGPLR